MGLTVYGGGGKPEEEKTVTAGTSVIEVLPSSGKTMKKVKVNPTPSQSKSVTPNESAQTVTPDSGKLLSSVSVGAIQTEEKTVTAGTSATTVTPTSGKYIKKVTVNPTPSQAKTVIPNQSTQTVKPSSGKLLSKVTVKPIPEILSEEWGSKHKAILNGGTSSVNNLDITIKCMTYYDRYLLALGSDANGDLYKLYTVSPKSAWTVVKLANNRNYPATGIACDGTNVWVSVDSGGYKNRIILYQALSDFMSSDSSTYYYYANSTIYFHDAVAYNNRMWLVGQYVGGEALTCMNTSDGGSSVVYNAPPSVAKPLIKCCMYNAYPVAITADGYYIHKASITEQNVSGLFQIASGFTSKCVAQMGDYLCVAGTKSDGTYLYYAKGTPGSLTWSYIKISSSVVTPIGLAYVNGLYVMVYIDTDGKTRYWCSTGLAMEGVYGINSRNASFVAQAIGVSENTMLVAGEKGTSIMKFAFTVS